MKKLKLQRKEIMLRTNEVEKAYLKYEKNNTKTNRENWFKVLNENFGNLGGN